MRGMRRSEPSPARSASNGSSSRRIALGCLLVAELALLGILNGGEVAQQPGDDHVGVAGAGCGPAALTPCCAGDHCPGARHSP